MSILEAIILGIIQGLTEFLPVSSSGHLELAKVVFGQNTIAEESMLFTIVLHGATALSTVVVFRQEIVDIFKGLLKFEWNPETKFTAFILVSMIPVGIVGLFFRLELESMFSGNILLVGVSLIFTAALLYSTTRITLKDGEMTFKRAILIGIAQAVAVLPGISRSGSTISVALLSGLSKDRAAKFSFLMILPVIFGAMLLESLEYMEAQPIRTIDNMSITLGFITAFIAGLFACTWMINIVKRAKLDYFAYYCVTVGIIAVIYGLI